MKIISGRKFLRIEMISADENNPGLKILPNKDAPSPHQEQVLKNLAAKICQLLSHYLDRTISK